jgi:hypothetical protein
MYLQKVISRKTLSQSIVTWKIRKQLLTTRKVCGMENLLRYIHSRSATTTFGFMFSSLMVYTPL